MLALVDIQERRQRHAAYMRLWNARNPEKVRAVQAANRAKTREKRRARERAWNAANPELHRAKAKAWRLANPEKAKAAKRKWLAENREKVLATQRRWRLANVEKRRARNRAWYAANPEKQRAATLRWERANPEKRPHYHAARRARKRGAAGSHSPQEWLEKCMLLGNVCIYCGRAKRLERDHKIPLVRGGTHGIDNIVPACASCNRSKGARTAQEFILWRAALSLAEAS